MQKMGPKNNEGVTSLAAIGEKLRSAREKKGVTIDQAQRQTHIHATVLTALESGRADEVLTSTYVKSFLKKYSSYLSLDSNQLINEYMTLRPGVDLPSQGFGVDSQLVKKQIGITGVFRIMRNALVVAVSVFFLVMMVKAAVRFFKAPNKKSAGKVSAQAKDPRGINAKKLQKKTADKPKAPQVSIPDNEPITLVMRVKSEVYVGVERDGVLLFKRLVPKGAVETVTAAGKLNVSIAKARSVELVLNGHPLDIVDKGAIKDLEITRKGIKVK